MRNALLGFVSLVAVAAAAGSAHANSAWPNWYLGLKGSVNYLDSTSIGGGQTGKAEYDNGFGYGVALGYTPAGLHSSTGKARFEVEYYGSKNDFDSGNINGVAGAFTGDQSVSALMVNAIYDFNTDSRWTPYVGAGVGYAATEVSGNLAGLAVDDEDNNIAWQLLGGIGYSPETLPFTTWTLGYRYFNAGDVKVKSAVPTQVKLDHESHNLEAGVQLKF
jgi:opacity protein-like surface antigen